MSILIRPSAKVLVYDIESYPHHGYTWASWETNVIAFTRERMVCSIAYKWLGEPEISCIALPMFKDYPLRPFNNRKLIRAFHKILCKADITIAHNGDRFDDKMVNTDIIKGGMRPPDPRRTIDTLKIARRYFSFASNRLASVASAVGIKMGKVQHPGFKMWLGCMEQDPASWDKMIRYNIGDVRLLERVYYKLRPWIKDHPDLSNFTRTRSCPACESRNLRNKGWNYSRHSRVPRYLCKDCGKPFIGSRQRLWREDS